MRLVRYLEDVGFQPHRTDEPRAFDNAMIIMERDPFALRIIRDRGSFAFEARVNDTLGWWDIDLWFACLDDRPAITSGGSAPRRVAAIVRRLHELVDAASRRDIEDCLRRRGVERTRTLLAGRR